MSNILYSKSTDKFYIGETHDIAQRVEKHNHHSYDNSYTKIASDWNLVLEFNCINKSEALFLEKFIKKMKSKKFIEKIILNPDLLADISSKNNI
ncbi:excinuclease ABC subunit C [Flavobacterium faecale]|uniref:Excinuclease ABC subunit C n=1 Tax=Flavobacterium faecale TaxID=1355330 RepID=A0A2S1LBR6_9FLAO|nr:excinuclease ABC subunit C [Flavobacterium faecale]